MSIPLRRELANLGYNLQCCLEGSSRASLSPHLAHGHRTLTYPCGHRPRVPGALLKVLVHPVSTCWSHWPESVTQDYLCTASQRLVWPTLMVNRNKTGVNSRSSVHHFKPFALKDEGIWGLQTHTEANLSTQTELFS